MPSRFRLVPSVQFPPGQPWKSELSIFTPAYLATKLVDLRQCFRAREVCALCLYKNKINTIPRHHAFVPAPSTFIIYDIYIHMVQHLSLHQPKILSFGRKEHGNTSGWSIALNMASRWKSLISPPDPNHLLISCSTSRNKRPYRMLNLHELSLGVDSWWPYLYLQHPDPPSSPPFLIENETKKAHQPFLPFKP